MRVFFRKHGNSLFYIILPIFFLFIVITFLEFTPRFSKSTVLDPCSDPDQCCNTSGCAGDIGETCVDDLCIRTNVGCPVGEVNDSPNGQCECIEDGEIVGKCVVCPIDEVFSDGDCVTPEGGKLEGGSSVMQFKYGCALHPLATSQGGSLSFYALALLPLTGLALRLRRRRG